jgi:hypothetical protein
MSNAADQTGEERKLTARERREKALEQLKAKQKKLEAQLQEDVAKEEKKNFLPLGKVLYTLCMDKRVDLSDPERLRRWVEGWAEFGMVASQTLKTFSSTQKDALLIAVAAHCKKESTQALLTSLGYKNGD